MLPLKKRITALLSATLLGISLLLSGCGNGMSTESSAAPQSSAGSQTSSFTLTDQAGRKVTFEKPAEKIVSCYYISSSLLIALGLQDKVVGIEMKADSRMIYKKAAPGFLSLPAVGSGKGINAEEIAKLDPDLVILPLKLQDSVQTLETLGIPALIIDPETVEGFIACIDLIAKATGAAERGESLAAYTREKMEEIKNKTADLADKPTVYLSAGSSYLNTCTSKMVQNDILTMAGGQNVSASLTDGYWQTVSPEQLLEWNPAYFLMVSYADYTAEDITGDSRLQGIDALENRRLYTFPSLLEPWDYPTPSFVLGVMWLTSLLHPDIVSEEDYKQEARSFYKTFYDIEVSDEDIGL